MAMMNFHLAPDITSLFMMPDEKYIHLNSSVIKDVVKNGGRSNCSGHLYVLSFQFILKNSLHPRLVVYRKQQIRRT